MKHLATLPTADLESLIAHATDELRKRREHTFEVDGIDYVYDPDSGRLTCHGSGYIAGLTGAAIDLRRRASESGWRTVATLAREMAVAHGVEL